MEEKCPLRLVGGLRLRAGQARRLNRRSLFAVESA
jgi:hypothetical protein